MDFNRFGTFEPSRSFDGSFFTNEAIRAGYITSGLAGSHLNDRHLSSREALRWEIEKDKIRTEMIADIIRRRQLEEEVRRELALEREMTLRQELQLLDSLDPAVPAENRFSFGGKLLPKSGLAIDRFRHEAGSSSETALAEPKAAAKKPVVFPVKTSNGTLRATKRKAPAPPAAAKGTDAELKKTPRSKKQLKGPTVEPRPKNQKVKKKTSRFMFWCGYCEVGCNSEVVRDSHLKGKKHAAKLEEVKVSGDTSGRAMPVEISSAKGTDKSEAATGMPEKDDGSTNGGEEVSGFKENKGVEVRDSEVVEQKGCKEVQATEQKENERIDVVGDEVREQKEDGEVEDAGDDVEEQEDGINRGP